MTPLPRASGRWAYPVVSPWKLRTTGQPMALLSARQFTLDWTARRGIRHNPWTLERLAAVTADPSRGHTNTALRRLRQLERIGFMTKRGRNGWTRVWIPRCLRTLTRTVRSGHPRGNDSGSTPSGTFLTADGLLRAWRRDRSPPSSARPPGGGPARRQRSVPRLLWGRCQSGHRVRLSRWSYTATATTLEGRWGGSCVHRGCGLPVIEHVRAIVEPMSPRPLSPAELAEPGLLERRRRIAAAFALDGNLGRLDPAVAWYLERPPGGPDADPAAHPADRRASERGPTPVRDLVAGIRGRPAEPPDDR